MRRPRPKELPQFLARWKRSLCCLWRFILRPPRLLCVVVEAEAEAGIAGSTHRSTPILLCVYFFMEAVGRSDLYNEGRRREVEATAAVCIKAE